MTERDPLTYLDEVDARAEAATLSEKWNVLTDHSVSPAQVVVEVDRLSIHVAADFVEAAITDVPALSKALRAVLATRPRPTDPIDLDLVARERALGYNRALADVRQTIQAALAVNDEGEKE